MADATLVSQGAGKRLEYPFEAPEVGETVEVAPGIHWLRMPLPFNLDHINLWLLEDGEGWTVVDTGLRGEASRTIWTKLFGTLSLHPMDLLQLNDTRRVLWQNCALP